MSQALFALIVMLGLPGVLPAFAAVRRSAAVVFLAPLVGAAMAAVAVELELGVGGSMLTWYVVLSVLVNAAVIAWWAAVRSSRRREAAPAWTWPVATVVVLGDAMVVPLTGLHALMFGHDANSIWLTHALMVSGGHRVLLMDMKNPAYAFSNVDYPPLVPAASALAFAHFGFSRLHLSVDVTGLLTACALGVMGGGIATAAERQPPLQRAAAVILAASLCLVGFALAGDGAIDGRADLLWSAAATAAVIFGLVLPKSTQALVPAGICAIVASLTKNEGLTTALIILVLVSLRYRPPSWRRRLPAGSGSRALRRRVGPVIRSWWERAAFFVVPALPGLAWLGLVHLLGIRDRFFGTYSPESGSPESGGMRAGATVSSVAPHLVVLPIAVGVLLLGAVFLHRNREGAGLGNPAWLWVVCLSYLGVLLLTYVVGSYEIHWWLKTSVSRTTIFPALLLFAELGIWLIVALGPSGSSPGRATLHSRDGGVESQMSSRDSHLVTTGE
ncbi:MAG TPA: hypothetical protein VEH29_09760 [Acidimicrobiales bacterium]|nr:hypothetical protein [Acidimicrobiales bacterium]